MATTGAKLTIPFTVGTAQIVGQGDFPEAWILYSTSDANAAPAWETVGHVEARSWSTSRGRENERTEIAAGTAEITLDNRERVFDPIADATVRTMNQWWIRAQFSGVTYDIWKGYAESYELSFPEGGWSDAVTVMRGADELKVLNLDRLPTMNPPRDAYADVVLFDQPQGYWRMQDQDFFLISPVAGGVGITGSGSRAAGAIVGDWPVDRVGSTDYGTRSATARWYTYDPDTLLPGLPVSGPGDAAGLSAFTFETWFKSSETAPAAAREIATGPRTGAGARVQWGLQHETSGAVTAYAYNTTPTLYQTTSPAALSADTWYHLAIAVTGSQVAIAVNGVVVNSTTFSGSVEAMDAGGFMYLGTATAVGGTRYYDEPAFYRYYVTEPRLLAHYQAGAFRGFPSQDPGPRIQAVLDAVGNNAPRSIRPGSRELAPTFMRGQSPLDELRAAEEGEAVDAVLFVAGDGTVTFLDDGHRSVSPWSTIQATFDDDGTDLPYADLSLSHDDSFVANEWNVTREGGTTQTASDTASIAAHKKRPMSLTSLKITQDTDADAIADAMLAKYKEPIERIPPLVLSTATPALAEAALSLDIGDRIRVFRTHPNGDRYDLTMFVQKIETKAANNGEPWEITISVSPL